MAFDSPLRAEAPEPDVTRPRSSLAKAAACRLLSLARPKETGPLAFLCALLVADFAFIAAFGTYAFAEHYEIHDSMFHGNVKFSFVEGGYAETYGYAKEAVLTLLLLAAYARSRQPLYLALSLLFGICALDDSMALHEAAGRYLSVRTGLSESAGELVGWSLLGSFPMLAFLVAYRRSDARSRRNAEAVVLAFAILLFFAVGMDLLHAIVRRNVTGFQTVLTVLEDGGELLTLTLLCTVSLAILRLSGQSPNSRAAAAAND